MKVFIAWCLAINLFVVPAFAFAAQDDPKGPSDRAYEKSDENAKFRRGDEGKARKAKNEKNRAKKVKPGDQGSEGDATTMDDEEEGRPADHKKKKGKGKKKK